MIQRRVVISGRVQGVGFRAATYRASMEHEGLRGYVRNLPDGKVEAVFSGPPEGVLAMVDWCRQGPTLARVIEAAVHEEPVDPGLGMFQIRMS